MKIKLILLNTIILFASCKTIPKQSNAVLPKIENYTKGELDIKVVPFGLNSPISIGKVATNGTIHFYWENDISSVKDFDFFMSSIKTTVGMTFCNKKEVEQNNTEAKSVDSGGLFLYKNDQQVGVLFPATLKIMEGNTGENRYSSLVLGSRLSWFYCDSAVQFKAKCIVNQKRENVYDFQETTNYTIQFKKGWNMVLNTLVEKQDWSNETQKGSLPKAITKTSITKIPDTINWYLKYWAND